VSDEQAVALLELLAARVEALRTALHPPEFYSIKEAATVVGVSPDHIRRAVTGGVLAASNLGTMARPTYRIARADLLAWFERGKTGGIAPAPRSNITPRSRHHRKPSTGRSSERGS